MCRVAGEILAHREICRGEPWLARFYFSFFIVGRGGNDARLCYNEERMRKREGSGFVDQSLSDGKLGNRCAPVSYSYNSQKFAYAQILPATSCPLVW